ncbi:MAG: DUF192 domain-containing protein [Halomonas sp.]|nr:DUF192 domain-containing protein [Halomonas sp.]
MKPCVTTAILALALLSPVSASIAETGVAETGVERLPLTVSTGAGPHEFRVEVADESAERSRGLMGREQLAEDAGMLFLYSREKAGDSGFWMYNTLIPLDIAFIDGEGHIVSTHTMMPCVSEAPARCPVTRPGEPYRAALEVNAGLFEELGIKLGDCVAWPGHKARCE